jgi:hypothetical protein
LKQKLDDDSNGDEKGAPDGCAAGALECGSLLPL